MTKYLSKKKAIISIITILAGIFIYAYLGSFLNLNKNANKDIRLTTVKKTDFVQKVTASGTITPFRQTIITAPYSGYVKKIYVQVGQRVKEGDPLVSIVESLQTKQNVYPIRAPYAGVVVLIQKSEGEFVKQNDITDFVLKIDDIHEMFVNVDIPELSITKIKVGQQAIVRATPILDQTYHGVVQLVSLSSKLQKPTNDRLQSQVVYPVNIMITSDKAGLKSGMSAIVDIIIAEKKKVMTLPHEFVHKDGDNYFVITDSGEKISIEIGLQNDEEAVIKDGINIGTRVKQINYFSE